MVKFDGHEYEKKEDIPDYGSIQNVWSSDDGKTRNYQGHTVDWWSYSFSYPVAE